MLSREITAITEDCSLANSSDQIFTPTQPLIIGFHLSAELPVTASVNSVELVVQLLAGGSPSGGTDWSSGNHNQCHRGRAGRGWCLRRMAVRVPKCSRRQERGPSANASVIWSEGATVDGLHRTCYAASAEASYTVATMACLSVCEMSKFA